jgi:serine/threonine-protein kinase RsbT
MLPGDSGGDPVGTAGGRIHLAAPMAEVDPRIGAVTEMTRAVHTSSPEPSAADRAGGPRLADGGDRGNRAHDEPVVQCGYGRADHVPWASIAGGMQLVSPEKQCLRAEDERALADTKMTHLTQEYSIKARDYNLAGDVSIKVQRLLKAAGLSPDIWRRAAICANAAEMNVVLHGGDGTLSLTVDGAEVTVEVVDSGPGMEDVNLALQEGYSTASREAQSMGFGAGLGLPNIRDNADALEIRSEKGEGTYLKMSFRTRAS